MSGLAPHPWDAIAQRVFPDAQTVADIERISALRAAERKADRIRELEFDIDQWQEEVNELEERIGEAETELARLKGNPE